MIPHAIVSSMSFSGLGVVRSLGRQGIPVIALDPDPWQTGMKSRYCRAARCPPVETDEEGHVEYLLSLARKLQEKPVLFATGDSTVLAYARHEKRLLEHFRFAGPDRRTIEKVVTKDGLMRTAEAFAVDAPVTFSPSSEAEVEAIAGTIPFPCILKPARAHSWHRRSVKALLRELPGGSEKVILCGSPEELLSSYRRIAEVDPAVIVSEVIPGDDRDLFYFVFYRSETHGLSSFVGRKERIKPPRFGSASYVVTARDEGVEAVCGELLRGLDYRGLGGIEVKRDARDGRYKLIEFNARIGLWDSLGQRCGVDTASIAYWDSIGVMVPRRSTYRCGMKWMSFTRDSAAILGYLREGRFEPGAWLRSLVARKQWAVFSWDDPLPSIVFSARLVARSCKKAIDGVRRRFRRRKGGRRDETGTRDGMRTAA